MQRHHDRNLQPGDHPPSYPPLGGWAVVVKYDPGVFVADITIDRPEPVIDVAGTLTFPAPAGQGEAGGMVGTVGHVTASGQGTYSGYLTGVSFEGELEVLDPAGSFASIRLEGEFSVGFDGTLPGGQPINYGLVCNFPPIEEPTATPTATLPPGAPTATPGASATSTPPPTVAPTATPRAKPLGDVNDDGAVNSLDALLILQFVAGLIGELPNPESADVNESDTIDSVDASLILQFEAGLLIALPRPSLT